MAEQASASSSWDVVVAGAGAAGRAAALAAAQAGAETLLIDLADRPGGALAAMGLWAGDDADLAAAGARRSYRTTLVGVRAGLELRMLSPDGPRRAGAKALVLASGGREQTRGNLLLPGTRPAGVLTAGAALRLLTASGRLPGRRAVIAGPGRWADRAARELAQAGIVLVEQATSVARIDGWPRVAGALLADGLRVECDLLVLATPLLPWLTPTLADAASLPGVLVAGAAAHGEIDAAEAAASGHVAGERAAQWAARGR
ncbi:MAG TPA: FAD-dependent oxidoreductase [Roseiflexaceae bacterium]|nr:FAD-dependent oxidoreductase [Roseiflexaceae bacterium]